MMDDAVDLYGDLNEVHNDIATQKLAALYEAATKENEALRAERDELLMQVQFLRDQKKTLESNVLSVFSTATNEVERKNRMIKNLESDLARAKASLAAAMATNRGGGH